MSTHDGHRTIVKCDCGTFKIYLRGSLTCPTCADSDAPPYRPYQPTQTSIEAAAGTNAKGDEARVLVAIRNSPHGLTDDDIEQRLNLRHQTASARRRGLVLKGLVVDSDRKRQTTSGRLAAVWVCRP